MEQKSIDDREILLNGFSLDSKKTSETSYSYVGKYLWEEVKAELIRSSSTPRWKLAHHQAIKNWLTSYQAVKYSPVKGYLEALYHLCELELWNTAFKILTIQPDYFGDQELSEIIEAQGYYYELISLYKNLLKNNFESHAKFILLGKLGNCSIYVGAYEDAMYYLQECLSTAQETGNLVGEIKALASLSLIYSAYGDYKQAIFYQEEYLSFSRIVKDFEGEAEALGNLGNYYYLIGDFNNAMNYQGQSLKVARSNKNQLGETRALNNIGTICMNLGDFDAAIKYFRRSLAFSGLLGNRQEEGSALTNLGLVYKRKGNYSEAISYLSQSIEIAKLIGDKEGISAAFVNIGLVYSCLGNHEKALEYQKNGLKIFQQIGVLCGEGDSLFSIGSTLLSLNLYSEAQVFLEKSRKISEYINNSKTLAFTLISLSIVYYRLHQLQSEDKYPASEKDDITVFAANDLQKSSENYLDLAIRYCDQALSIATELGLPLAKECQKLKEEISES